MNYKIKEETLTGIADAIRSKTGKTEEILAASFAGNINSIDTSKPEETKEVLLDFSGGDMEVVPTTGNVISKVTIPQPENLLPENIAEGVNVAGIVGVLAASGGDPSDIGAEKYLYAQYAEVDLPNAESIKPYAFYYDTVLTNISMPKVKRIGKFAFYKCSKLALTSLPSGVTSIGENAFEDCTKLALTFLPGSITIIESSAFKKCTGLTSITFENLTANIYSNIFEGCTNLTTINVPWAEGQVSGAPWGATNATINYNYTGG